MIIYRNMITIRRNCIEVDLLKITVILPDIVNGISGRQPILFQNFLMEHKVAYVRLYHMFINTAIHQRHAAALFDRSLTKRESFNSVTVQGRALDC